MFNFSHDLSNISFSHPLIKQFFNSVFSWEEVPEIKKNCFRKAKEGVKLGWVGWVSMNLKSGSVVANFALRSKSFECQQGCVMMM